MPNYLPTVDWQVGVASGWSINSVAKPASLQIAAENQTIRVIYGTVRVAAQIANVLYYNGNWIVQAIWGEGLCTSIGSITFNDETPINGGTRTDYLGTASPTVDATLVSAFAAQSPAVTYVDTLPNICYSVFSIPAGVGIGLPTIHAIIGGRAVADPRENRLIYSEDFSNAAWTKANCTATANTGVAPDFSTTMDKITLTGGSVVHYVYQVGTGTTPADNSAITHRYSVRNGTLASGIVAIEGQLKTGTNPYASFNLATGVVSAVSGCTATIRQVDTGLYELTMTIADVGTGASNCQQSALFIGSHAAYNGDGEYVEVWGGQVVSGIASASAYCKSVATIVTPTTAYSDNPALCTADFASNTRFGCALTVDMASVCTVAERNDELVGGAKRRRLDLAIEEQQDASTWIDVLATYAGAWAFRDGASLMLVSDSPAGISRTFLHASGQIRSIAPLKLRSVATMPTIVEIRHTVATQIPWRNGSQWDEVSGVTAGTFPRRESQIPLLGIKDASQALREAQERRKKLTTNLMSITLGTFDEGLGVQLGEVIAVSHPKGLTLKPFRVMKARSDAGRHEFDLLEYNVSVFSNATASVATPPDTTLPNPASVPTPASLTITSGSAEQITLLDGTVINRMKAAWTAPTNTFVLVGGFAVVQYKKTADSDWIARPPIAAGSGPVWISSVIDGTGYDIRVRFENSAGTIGAWATASHTVGAHTGGVIGGQNLLQNSDMDSQASSKPNGYDIYNNAAVTTTMTNAAGVTGGNSFSVRATSAHAAGGSNNFGLYTDTALTGDGITGGVTGGWQVSTDYVITFYAKRVTVGAGGVAWTPSLQWNTWPASTTWVDQPALTSSYQRYRVRITTGGTVEATGRLLLDAANGLAIVTNDEVAFDRVQVQRGNVATEWAPYVVSGATANRLTYSSSAPAIIADGDVWVDTSVTPNLTKFRVSGAWQVGANYSTNTSQLTDGANLGGTATWSGVSGSGKPADNATKNTTTYSASAPASPTDGDIWVDTAGTPTITRLRAGGAWTLAANYSTNTNQLTDGANLGGTAIWTGVSGSGKPADNATKNTTTYSASAPASPTDGDIWVDTAGTPTITRLRAGGAWTLAANYSTNTNQLTDGANLGGTATWAGVSSVAVATSQVVNNAITTAGFVAENGYDRFFTAGSFGASSGTDDYASLTVTPVSGDIVLVEASFRVITNNSSNALDFVTLTPKITCSGDSSASISAVAALWRVYDGVQYQTHRFALTYTSGGAALTVKLQIYYAIAAFTNSAYAEYTIDQCVLKVFTSRK